VENIILTNSDTIKSLFDEVLQYHLGQISSSQNTTPDEVLTPTEAAEFLRITLPTLRKYSESGILPKVSIGKIPRYLKSDLIEALKQGNLSIRSAKRQR
jgi:hypothetical protein